MSCYNTPILPINGGLVPMQAVLLFGGVLEHIDDNGHLRPVAFFEKALQGTGHKNRDGQHWVDQQISADTPEP